MKALSLFISLVMASLLSSCQEESKTEASSSDQTKSNETSPPDIDALLAIERRIAKSENVDQWIDQQAELGLNFDELRRHLSPEYEDAVLRKYAKMIAWNYNFTKTDPARREFFRKDKLGKKLRFEVISESRQQLLQEPASRGRLGGPPMPFTDKFRKFLKRGNFKKVQRFYAVRRWITLDPINRELPEGHAPKYLWDGNTWKAMPDLHILDSNP